jgi:hypothetical protein
MANYYDTDYARVRYLSATDYYGARLAVTTHSPLGIRQDRVVEGRQYDVNPGEQAERIVRRMLGLSPTVRLARVFVGDKEDLFIPIIPEE